MSTISVAAGHVSRTTPVAGAPRRAGSHVGTPAASRAEARVATAPTRMRLTRRGRIVLVGLGLALAAAVGSIAGQAVAEPPAVEQATTTVVVAPGETLWTIAQGVAEPGEDVRDVVAAIADLNDLADLQLVAGAELLLPAS